MTTLLKIGRSFYGVAVVAYGIQQFIYGNFRNVQLPAWQAHLPLLLAWAWLTGAGMIAAGAAIVLNKKAKAASLLLGGSFLFFFLFVHIPYECWGEVNSSLHLALWVDALKELALSGGAFVMAASFADDPMDQQMKSGTLIFLERFTPFGPLFFLTTMVSFGFMHFMYADFVSKLVPAWFPDPVFWTYFTGAALVASGIAIMLKIRPGMIALLLCAMIFIWLITLHVPRALTEPFGARANEISSAFDALAFTGIALVISLRDLKSDALALRLR